MGPNEDQIRQYQVDGSLRADEMLFGVMRFLGRTDELKDWVVKQNNKLANEALPTYNLSGITDFMKKNKMLVMKTDEEKKNDEQKESKKGGKKNKKKNSKKVDDLFEEPTQDVDAQKEDL